MRELETIQTKEKLNNVYALDDRGNGNANHKYCIESADELSYSSVIIQFQDGPRKSDYSIHGVLDTDLLEIVRDRLKGFQSGPYNSPDNACALNHIEDALRSMNRRVEDRIARSVLGTNQK